MATSDAPSTIRVSQKRLTIAFAILASFGTLALALIWWDSMFNTTAYSNDNGTFTIDSSAVNYWPLSLKSIGLEEAYVRGDFTFYLYRDKRPLFPLPDVSSDHISIPIYLLILTYLATLLLIWIVLMNRLARRGFTKAISSPSEH